MASRLLRNIAVSIGAGLAAGFGRRFVSSRRPHRPVASPTQNLYPILTRIEEIESRVTLVELAPPAPAALAPEEIAALGTLVSSQSEDIAALREDIQRIERRNAEQIEAFGQKVVMLERQVPAHIETSVNAKMAELEERLRGEFRDIHYRTVDAFAETIENRVVGRITALENSLIEQSHSIVALREKSLKTDDNLTRLLEAVEKLCVRAEVQSQISLVHLEAKQPEPKSDAPPPAPEPAVAEVKPQAQPDTSARWQPEDTFTAHYQRTLTEESPQAKESNGMLPVSSNGHSDSTRRGFKPVGVAILGLAILGFRLMR